MILSAIAAMAKNRVIGVDNKLPWNIPEDMQYFRDKTKGHIMIMGRKTFESFGGKPLPGRMHIVITRSAKFKFEHPLVRVVNSLDAAVKEAAKHTLQYGKEVFVIGGGEIYRAALPILNRIYLTIIELEYPGDATFPEFDENVFKLISRDERPGFAFCLYKRLG
jgi:dihydrofolate reductase